MAERVVVAMSGGVDSSVAAALLAEAGYDVVGVMMRLWAEPARAGVGDAPTNRCCSLESVNDARAVADRLGIPFYVIDVAREFKDRVVDFFIDGYASGVTPNPCLACNRRIRFGYLLDYARGLGAHYLATGHYARVRRGPDDAYQLWRGLDPGKDQSYVLSVLGQADLRQALFPIGEYAKPEVRALAAARGLPTASRAWRARISVFWPTATTGAFWPNMFPMPCSRGRSWIGRNASWENIAGCPITRSGSAAGWALPQRNRSTCSNSTGHEMQSSWGRRPNWGSTRCAPGR